MRNLSTLFVPALILSTLVFPFFGCKELPDAVEEKSVSETSHKDIVVMNDSIWREDSLKMWGLWEHYWFFDDNYRNDSAIAVCQKMIEVGKPMMEYRFDSTIYEKYAKAFGGIGYNLLDKGQLDEGIEFTKKSFNLITAQFGENHPRNPELCASFTIYYEQKGDFEQALKYCDKSYKIIKNSIQGLHYYEGNIYLNYAGVFKAKNDWGPAVGYIQKAIEVYKKTAPPALLAAYHNLGISYLHLKKYEKAKVSAVRCIRLATEEKERKKSGFFYFPTGKKKDEWHYFDLPAVYVLLGAVERELGNYTKSLENIKKGIELGQRQWEISGNEVAKAWLELGKTYARMDKPAEAMKAFKKVNPIVEKYAGKGKGNEIAAWNEAGDLQLELGNRDSAVFYFQKALYSISPEFPEADFYKNAHLEDLGTSLVLLETLKKKARALQSLFEKSNNWNALASSLSTFTLATHLTDKMRYGFKWESSKQTLSERMLPIFEGAIETTLRMHQQKKEMQYLDQALAFAERSKAFTLLENLHAEKAKTFAGIAPELLSQEEIINREISIYNGFIIEEKQNTQNPDSAKLNYWENKLVDLKKSQDSLTSIFEKNYPNYYRLKYENPPFSVAKLQNQLAENETLLEYFLGDSTLFTFTVDHSGLEVHQQKIDSVFFNAVDRLRVFSKSPSSDATWIADYQHFVQDSRYLYGILMESAQAKFDQPFAREKRPSLLIVPDGVLNFLPFNLLLTRQPDAVTLARNDYRNLPYLLRDFDIRYEYSATLMLESKRSNPGGFWHKLWHKQPTYCGFAPSYGDGNPIASRGEMDSLKLTELYPDLQRGELHSLKFNIPEVEGASQLMRGQAFTGRAATEAEFKKQAKNADVLHLAMHALTNDKDPLFSQLAFERDPLDTSEDGRLHAYELYNMRLKADLAVLSACNTGAGKLQRGEGVMSLSRAFKYAGCANVVMSLWTVSDEATKTIIGNFFKQLKNGKGKDEALCQAQRDFVGTATQRFTHPYYWSTMVLIGDDEPLWKPGVPPFLWLVGILVALGLLTLFGRVRK